MASSLWQTSLGISAGAGSPRAPPALPPREIVLSLDAQDGVTVVMPAYREEANLASTVEDMLATLDSIGERHVVIIVDDGSDDKTGKIADDLAVRYRGRALAIHHAVNRGYGAAVRTGIAAALEQTDSGWIFLTDSDGQFRGAQLPAFLAEARAEGAGAVIGYREHRADPAMRKVNAWLWHLACRILLGVAARDVDCAYKLISRQALDGLALRGDRALISPELLLGMRARNVHVLQRPVAHYRRMHGRPTGANLSVIALSLLGLLGLFRRRLARSWARLTDEDLGHRQRGVRRDVQRAGRQPGADDRRAQRGHHRPVVGAQAGPRHPQPDPRGRAPVGGQGAQP